MSSWQFFTPFSISTIIILHRSKEEDAAARPGLATVLLCSLPVVLLTGFDSSEWEGVGWSFSGHGWVWNEHLWQLFCTDPPWLARCHPDTNCGVASVPGQFVSSKVGLWWAQLRAKGWPGVLLTGEATDLFWPPLTGDLKGQEITPCHWPGTLWFVFGHQFAFTKCRGRFESTGHAVDQLVFVLTPTSYSYNRKPSESMFWNVNVNEWPWNKILWQNNCNFNSLNNKKINKLNTTTLKSKKNKKWVIVNSKLQ